jgi:hypothetical protein
MASYATERKLRIICDKEGENWQQKYPGKSIDAVYNLVTGDRRKNLFSKVSPSVKAHLDEMSTYEGASMSEMLEKCIEDAYSRHLVQRSDLSRELTNQFSGQSGI